MKIASIVPRLSGASGRGGRASATSNTETTNPPSSNQPSPLVTPQGSQATPEGTPNITTARRSAPAAATTQPIHGPAHTKDAASATGTRPRPIPPSQRITPQPAASSSGSDAGSSSRGNSRIVARQAA